MLVLSSCGTAGAGSGAGQDDALAATAVDRPVATASADATSTPRESTTPSSPQSSPPRTASGADTTTRPSPTAPTSKATPPPNPAGDPAGGTALAAVAGLEVKGRAPKTGYDRLHFGHAWADADRNGCDTRNDMLRRDLTALEMKGGTDICVVLAGALAPDPYTGARVAFVRGGASEVDIDHVVALSDAWQKGAQQWEPRKRLAFANDPLNLLAVDAGANRQKGDGDTATWLPSNRSYRCAYVARQVSVKAKYEVWVTAAERDAMVRVLSGCPDQGLLTSSAPTIAPIRPPAPPSQQPAPPPAQPSPPAAGVPSQQGASDPRVDTCKEAKAAGHGPYVQGTDPEYAWYRDADSDGTVCE